MLRGCLRSFIPKGDLIRAVKSSLLSLRVDFHSYNFSESTNFKNQLSAEFLLEKLGKNSALSWIDKILKLPIFSSNFKILSVLKFFLNQLITAKFLGRIQISTSYLMTVFWAARHKAR